MLSFRLRGQKRNCIRVRVQTQRETWTKYKIVHFYLPVFKIKPINPFWREEEKGREREKSALQYLFLHYLLGLVNGEKKIVFRYRFFISWQKNFFLFCYFVTEKHFSVFVSFLCNEQELDFFFFIFFISLTKKFISFCFSLFRWIGTCSGAATYMHFFVSFFQVQTQFFRFFFVTFQRNYFFVFSVILLSFRF